MQYSGYSSTLVFVFENSIKNWCRSVGTRCVNGQVGSNEFGERWKSLILGGRCCFVLCCGRASNGRCLVYLDAVVEVDECQKRDDGDPERADGSHVGVE